MAPAWRSRGRIWVLKISCGSPASFPHRSTNVPQLRIDRLAHATSAVAANLVALVDGENFVHRNGSEDMLRFGSDRLRTPAEVALHDCAAVVWSSGVVRDCVHPGSHSIECTSAISARLVYTSRSSQGLRRLSQGLRYGSQKKETTIA